MEFLSASGRSTISSAEHRKHAPAAKRVVKVKKFDPTHVVPSVASPKHKASPSSELNHLSPNHQPQKHALIDPVSSHVEVKAAHLPAPRWPPKPIRRKDIEAKPWYLWTFEEATEYHMGDQIREERFGSYNKSFVTKLNKKQDTTTAFGSKISSVSNNITAKALKQQQSRSATSSSGAMKKLPSEVRSSTGSVSRRSDDAISAVTARSTSQQPLQHKDAVAAEVRGRRLKKINIVAELEEVREQTAALEIATKADYQDVQRAMRLAENSDAALKAVESQAIKVIASTRAGIGKILHQRKGQQESLRELIEQQQHQLRRMSIKDAASFNALTGTASHDKNSSMMSSMAQMFPRVEDEFPIIQVHDRNYDEYTQRLQAEKRRVEVRAMVRRGLRRFAMMQRIKKMETRKAQQQAAGKKTVRIAQK